MLFSRPENALALYNSLNGTAYTDVGMLEFNTLENAIYMNVKNDVSFLIARGVNLYEHQSTYNPNMSLRNLLYLTDLLEREMAEQSLYSSKLLKEECAVLREYMLYVERVSMYCGQRRTGRIRRN